MDYEKKYSKALQLAKSYYGTGCNEFLDTIFPELKESEDERIRKAIEGTIRVYGKTQGEWLCGYDMDTLVVHLREAFGALEKQKEQKPKSCDCSRDEESYTNGIHHVLMNPEAYGLIKQKPAEQLGGTFTSYDIAKTFTEGQNYVIAHPEKFGLCKPAEWSEENKEIMHDIIKYHYDQGEISLKHNKWASWLEHKYFSLQSHWKPSKKQIEALTYATGEGGKYNKAALKSLLYDLQKLL